MASIKSESDTSELEILSVDLIASEEELEMDADTFSLEDGEPANRSAELLRSDLRSKDERISSLQYDIEQLRSRWNGLEKEIEAREELTGILQGDLKAAHKQLQERDRHIRRLEKELETADVTQTVVLDEHDDIDADLDTVDDRIENLTRQAGEDAERIRQLEQDLEHARAAESTKSTRWVLFGDLPKKYSERGKEITALKRSEETLQRELRDADTDRGRVKAMLKVAQEENAELKAKLKKTRSELKDYTGRERPAQTDKIARQEGQIVDLNGRLAQLEGRLEQSEGYGDELRQKLAEAQNGDEDLSAIRAELEETLAESRKANAELETEIDSARRQVEQLEQELEQAGQRQEEALESLRVELKEAQDTIASKESINEELAADLIEKTAARDALRRDLERSEQALEERIATLSRSLEQADGKLSEAEEKLENKDKSIATLLSELASKSESIDSIDEIEEAIQDLNGRISDRIDDRTITEIDRPNRLLIGHFEGQDLRLQIDKDRLTVGRTFGNDIQLQAQYISRHHAIILIEDGKARIVDWGSKNGIYINHERVSEGTLADGDTVMIGNAEFVFREEPANTNAG